MIDQEKINESLQRQIDAQNARLDQTLTKVDMLIGEIHEVRADMREIRAEMRDINKRIDDVNKRIDDKFDKFSSQLHTMTITAVVGFGAIAVAVGGLIFAKFK